MPRMPRGRKPTVVDTNVAVVANHREGGSYACASSCAQALLKLRSNGILLVDSHGLILSEYAKYLNYKGEPGVGDAFFRWFFNNRGRRDLCREVILNELDHAWRRFHEFPDDDALNDFDKDDQKFVATARAEGPKAEILQASDHKWLRWNPHLERHSVVVRFLCPEELAATARRRIAT
jgi:hypothetical protein